VDSSSEPITVLVVEDNPAHQEYIIFLLKKLGFNIVKASNAETALELLNGLKIDCALLDIHLGSGMDGIQLMHKLREKSRYESIPIISVTAFYTKENKNMFIRKGFTNFLAKPFDYTQLNTMLENHLFLA
jgi:CheY-like chemotaxis protein